MTDDDDFMSPFLAKYKEFKLGSNAPSRATPGKSFSHSLRGVGIAKGPALVHGKELFLFARPDKDLLCRNWSRVRKDVWCPHC